MCGMVKDISSGMVSDGIQKETKSVCVAVKHGKKIIIKSVCGDGKKGNGKRKKCELKMVNPFLLLFHHDNDLQEMNILYINSLCLFSFSL